MIWVWSWDFQAAGVRLAAGGEALQQAWLLPGHPLSRELANPLAVEVDHDGGGDADGGKDIPRQANVVRLVEGLGEVRGAVAGDLDQLVERLADGQRLFGDLRGREAALDEQLPREFILGREDVIELRAEFALDRPADQDGRLGEADPHGLLVRRRDVAEELAELRAGQHLARC